MAFELIVLICNQQQTPIALAVAKKGIRPLCGHRRLRADRVAGATGLGYGGSGGVVDERGPVLLDRSLRFSEHESALAVGWLFVGVALRL
jgi:hypothetical protein